MQDLPSLSKRDLDPDPFRQFAFWFESAAAAVPHLPEAMALATADREGRPSARMVLLKDFDERGFVFFTNYDSRKGRELAENAGASLVFHWRELQRQICIVGTASRISEEESEAYFRSRPRLSQIAAHASPQSQVIPSRTELEQRFAAFTEKFEGQEVPLPAHWGGFRLSPFTIEFWQNQRNRLHDRLLYTRLTDGGWRLQRLAP